MSMSLLLAAVVILNAVWHLLLRQRLSALQTLGAIWYTTLMGVLMIFAWFVVVVAELVLSPRVVMPLACYLSRVVFTIVMWLNPQITVTHNGMGWDELPEKCIVLVNHSSWMDSIIVVTSLPMHLVPRLKTLLKNTLLDIPIAGRVFRAVGHFPVFFRKDVEGSWEVDRAKQALVMESVLSFMKQKGHSILGFYPEGIVNKKPETLATFRRGSFQIPIDLKLPIYSYIMVNNELSWPVGGIPGLPASIHTSLVKICDTTDLPQDLCNAPALAEHTRGFMQKELDTLRANVSDPKELL